MSGFDQLVTFIRIADLDRSSAFYGDVLGLEMVRDQGPCRIYRVSGEAFVGVCLATEPFEPDDRVIITLVADDIEGWARRLTEAGVTIEKPPTEYPEFQITHLFTRDPDGYLVEIQRFWESLG
ncbi:MAG: VOC family protein [Acidimicrobiia bacterium]|nr:VOC family protein [Acidimicrobiia bacterium]